MPAQVRTLSSAPFFMKKEQFGIPWKVSIFFLIIILLAYFAAELTIFYSVSLPIILFFVIFCFGSVLVYYYWFLKNKKKWLFLFGISGLFLFVLIFFSSAYSQLPTNSTNYISDSDNANYSEEGNITNLNFKDAFYFSTVTLSTTGYGDITPHGYFRDLVITEILLGVFLTVFTLSGIYSLLKEENE
ncbi:hypothetical protein HYV86_03880 [Candidatus Woesearchaeota archaeon]|nr:hypothetical protein [Candidatus Woesearchaeota archaeon]